MSENNISDSDSVIEEIESGNESGNESEEIGSESSNNETYDCDWCDKTTELDKITEYQNPKTKEFVFVCNECLEEEKGDEEGEKDDNWIVEDEGLDPEVRQEIRNLAYNLGKAHSGKFADDLIKKMTEK
jgi:hypothetical protein